MIYLHGAILINEHKRAGLVEMGHRKTDAEFDRSDRNAPFSMGMVAIPGCQSLPANRKPAGPNQPTPNGLNAVFTDFHTIVGSVGSSATAIKIRGADNLRRQSH